MNIGVTVGVSHGFTCRYGPRVNLRLSLTVKSGVMVRVNYGVRVEFSLRVKARVSLRVNIGLNSGVNLRVNCGVLGLIEMSGSASGVFASDCGAERRWH